MKCILSCERSRRMAMIDVRQAVKSAIDYVYGFKDLMPVENARLEETELRFDDQGDQVWVITLSFVENQILGTRSFKTFHVDANNGTVKSMRSRNLVGR